jgi:hypothetical protein
MARDGMEMAAQDEQSGEAAPDAEQSLGALAPAFTGAAAPPLEVETMQVELKDTRLQVEAQVRARPTPGDGGAQLLPSGGRGRRAQPGRIAALHGGTPPNGFNCRERLSSAPPPRVRLSLRARVLSGAGVRRGRCGGDGGGGGCAPGGRGESQGGGGVAARRKGGGDGQGRGGGEGRGGGTGVHPDTKVLVLSILLP